MATLTKRATIYFDPALHRALKVRALETEQSVSDIVNEAIRHELSEDEQDLATIKRKEKEPTVSYHEVLKILKADGKI